LTATPTSVDFWSFNGRPISTIT